jgi:outer membrane protein TolC
MRASLGSLLVTMVCLAATPAVGAEPHGPLTLRDCLGIALRGHPALRKARADVDAARQRVWQEVAGYLPRGAYTYNFTRQARPLTAILGGGRVGETVRRETTQLFNFNDTAFSVNQVLFDFGRNLDSIQSALASKRARQAEREAAAQDVVLNVKRSYYDVLSAGRLLRVAERTLERNRKNLDLSLARHQVGLAPVFDVTQARVQVANSDLELVGARNDLALARENLRRALGLGPPFEYELVDDLGGYERRELAVERLVARARRFRPELVSLLAERDAAAERLSALRKEYLPSLSGNAQYNWTGRDFPLRAGWNVGLAFTVPLFDSVLTAAQIGEAKAELRSREAEIEDLRQEIELEVRRAWLAVRRAQQAIVASRSVLREARENMEIAEGRYAAGVGDILELSGAEVSLSQAEADEVRALADYKVSLAELDRAVGIPIPELVREDVGGEASRER